jgi:hypothetical protein
MSRTFIEMRFLTSSAASQLLSSIRADLLRYERLSPTAVRRPARTAGQRCYLFDSALVSSALPCPFWPHELSGVERAGLFAETAPYAGFRIGQARDGLTVYVEHAQRLEGTY